MLLRDVMYSLSTGELNNLSCVDEDTGLIKPAYYGRIVTSTNLAVTDLHTRFLIKKGTARVTLKEDQVVYPITARFLKKANGQAKEEQFLETQDNLSTLLKILEVRDDKNCDIPLNDGNHIRGIVTPSFNTLNVSSDFYKEFGTRTLQVDFQKNGVLICTGDRDFDPEMSNVDIDARYLHALTLFVASRLHNPSGFGTGGVHEGNNYHTLYLEECARLSNTGQQISESSYGQLRRQGFP